MGVLFLPKYNKTKMCVYISTDSFRFDCSCLYDMKDIQLLINLNSPHYFYFQFQLNFIIEHALYELLSYT